MNMKTLKIISALSIAIVIIFNVFSVCYALTPANLQANTTVNGVNEIGTFGNQLMGIIQTAGVVVAVIIVMVLGIKYMMGSAEERAEYKKTMMPYLVGAILIFAASTIANVVYQFSTSL